LARKSFRNGRVCLPTANFSCENPLETPPGEYVISVYFSRTYQFLEYGVGLADPLVAQARFRYPASESIRVELKVP